MIISCNECDSSFEVDDNLIKETGSKVRCSKCDSVFLAYPQPLDSEAGDDLGLEDLDSSLAGLDDDEESFDVEGLGDELELDLDDFDDALSAEDGLDTTGLVDDSEDDLGLDLNLDDDDDSELGMLAETEAADELPDLGDFEDLAGLDDAALDDDELDIEDEAEGLDDLSLDLDATADVDDDLDMSDLDLEGDEELDLADLDLEEDDEPGLDLEDAADSDDFGLDLDLDAEDLADGELADAGTDIEEPEGLDLSDLDLEVDDADEMADAGSDDLDLDLDLEEEPAGIEEVTDAGDKIEEADELDLSDLELEVSDSSAPDDTADAVSDDLNLDLDLDSEAEALAGATGDTADELDLSDLEDIIESEESAATADTGDGAVEDLELDLALDDASDPLADDAGTAAAGDNELDLSDLEEMLETDDAPAADDAGDDLDLQFDIDDPSAADGAIAPAATEAGDDSQDDDLLDIEKMLEQGDDDISDMVTEEEDLSLTMEAALDDAAQSADDELDLDFDIESELQEKEDLFDGSAPADDALESNLLDSDDAEFLGETGLEEDSEKIDVMTDEFATDDFSSTEGDFGATDVLPVEDEDIPETPAVKPAKKRSKKPVLVTFLLLLLAVGVLIIPKSLGIHIPYISDIKVPYLSDLDLKIPYLSDWLNPQEQDVTGNLKIMPMGRTISGNFVETEKAGRLFVIRGKIKNQYDHPRSFVKVTGKLYQKGKKLARKSTVYVGNVISNQDLAGMGIADINKRMKNKFGAKKSNLKIKSGKVVPFMIVFDKLPKNLDEYTVEVASSSI